MLEDAMWFNRKDSARKIAFKERKDDPNVGKYLSSGFPETDYIPMYSDKGKELDLSRFNSIAHLGGTSCPCQDEPDGFSPFYIEFDEGHGDPNLGGDGVAQLDMLNDKLNWACG